MKLLQNPAIFGLGLLSYNITLYNLGYYFSKYKLYETHQKGQNNI